MIDPSKKQRIGYALGIIQNVISEDKEIDERSILEQTVFEDYIKEKAEDNKQLEDAIIDVGLSTIYKKWLEI